MAQINAKIFESKFNEYLSKLIYAQFDDAARDWNGTIKYNPLMYMSYQTLLLEKKSRPDGLKSRFTISSEVRQYLTKLFSKLVEEFGLIQMVDGDNITTILEKLEEANAECYSSFMFKLGAAYKDKFGASLKAACDSSLWFHNQIVGFLPTYANKQMLIAIVSTEFETFLKAIAWIIGKLIWYYEVSISSEFFLGTLAQQNLSQEMLDELSSGLRAKTPAKPRTKKAAASTPVTPDTPGTPVQEVNAVQAAPEVSEADDVAAMLEDV